MNIKIIYLNDRIRRVLILTASSFALSLILFLSNALDVFELKAYDLFSRHLNPAKSSNDIVIIQVDQGSIDTLSEQGITWPWPRQVYAPIVEYLSEADAVFIDILFTEPSSYGEEDDLIFAEAIKKAENVYLPVFLSRNEKTLPAEDEEFIKRIAIKNAVSSPYTFSSVVAPIDVLRSPMKGSGNITIAPDEDGVYRKMPLVFRLKEYVIPHFVLGYLMEKGVVKVEENSVYAKDIKIPLADGKLILRFSTKDSPFKTFSAAQIVRSYLDVNASIAPAVRKESFRGKVVFIGLTAAGLYDLKPTSVSSVSTGVFIHATTLDNIIREDFIKPVNSIFVIISMLLICLLVSYSVVKSYSLPINLSVFLALLTATLLITAVLFRVAIYMNIIPLITSLVLSFIVSVAYSYATEGKERLLLKRTLMQYMDKRIANYIIQNPSLMKVGGRRKRVTVFFADIAGFTSIAEVTPPEQIATILHAVLNLLTEVVISNNGVIDKYIGDCVMAFWGAPIDTDRDEENACMCATRCLEAMNQINDRFQKEGISKMDIRIGIHSGEAIAGNLGSDRLFNYTVIGDTVNLASRLESVNKFFKTRVMISEDTFRYLDDNFLTRELGSIAVKGKTLPVKIFEMVGEESNVEPDKKRIIEIFNQGMMLYKEEKWREALEIFDKLLEEYPYDGPSEFYKMRCEYIMSNSHLTEDWNIIKFTEK